MLFVHGVCIYFHTSGLEVGVGDGVGVELGVSWTASSEILPDPVPLAMEPLVPSPDMTSLVDPTSPESGTIIHKVEDNINSLLPYMSLHLFSIHKARMHYIFKGSPYHYLGLQAFPNITT